MPNEAKVKKAAQRSAERALKEERLALAAIAKCFCMETGDPARLLRRLETMASNAERDPKVKLAVRRALVDGAALIRTTIERELRKPQSLLDPDVGHTMPQEVDRVVAHSEADQQMLLGEAERGVGEVKAAQDERVDAVSNVYRLIVSVLQNGEATDIELYGRYLRLPDRVPQSYTALTNRRKELVAAGRLRSNGGDPTRWTLVES